MFHIDIEICSACGGPVKVIVCVEDQEVIRKILAHLKDKAEPDEPSPLPESRVPPMGLFA